MMNGIECFDAMRCHRYHVATFLVLMVFICRNAMILLYFYARMDWFQIMVFELNQGENHADRYQAAQPQAEGQALQGE